MYNRALDNQWRLLSFLALSFAFAHQDTAQSALRAALAEVRKMKQASEQTTNLPAGYVRYKEFLEYMFEHWQRMQMAEQVVSSPI